MKKRLAVSMVALVVAMMLFTTTASAASVMLKMGSSGEKVKTLQTYLNVNGYELALDGKFGKMTKAAVMDYQKTFKLKVDGIVGPATWGRLEKVEKFIAIAKSKLGYDYVSGGKGPNSFDCSGFVYWCLNQAGVDQSYMTSAMWQKTTAYKKITNMEDLKRGDVLSFQGHVGIYLGNGDMISALNSDNGVCISMNILSSTYRINNFVAGFRIF